jgi:hypothetical protein
MSVRAPLARSEDLVVEELEDEVLIYDQRSDHAHCLGASATRVWRACDGRTTVEQLSAALDLDAATVIRALEELDETGLLDSEPTPGVTRREATVKMAKFGAAAASAPMIYSIIAPTPALATSEAACFKLCPTGCGECQQAGCCCTAPGGGSFKVCSADLASCQALVAKLPFTHCGETITSLACSAGC